MADFREAYCDNSSGDNPKSVQRQGQEMLPHDNGIVRRRREVNPGQTSLFLTMSAFATVLVVAMLCPVVW